MTKRILVFIFLLTMAASMGAVSQSHELEWSPGMYWTYDATLNDRLGITGQGEVTFLVLSEDSSEGLHRWNLAVITDWYDGTELLAITSHSTSGTQYPWRRWPQIVDYLPHTHLPSLETPFRRTVGSLGLPWIGEEYSVTYQITPRPPRSESITLAELASLIASTDPVLEDAITQSDVVLLQYEWSSHYSNLTEERDEGTALWSSSEQWWAHAEGEVFNFDFPIASYEVSLSSSGTLTSADLLQRLNDALDSTMAVIPEYAAGLIEVFERIGIDLPSN